MLTYDFSKRDELSLYEYLYKCIREDILCGRLLPGEKLPSKREMAANNSVSVITVQNAYEQLILEGYIEAKEKRGYFISDIDLKDGSTSGVVKKSSYHIIDTPENGEKCCDNKDVKINFSSNTSSDDLFPYSVWAKLVRKNLLDEKQSLLGDFEKTGALRLREAIARHLYEYRGLLINPDNIVIGAGTEFLYSLLVQLLGRNGMMAVEDPGHLKVSQVYEMNGVKVLHIPVDSDGLMISKLGNNNVTAIHITPSHHFPTGVVMPASRRHELLGWAISHNSIIIEDDYDSEFRFQGKPIPTLASLNPEKVIYMNTFSKTLTPSIRIAYMVLPEKLMSRYREKLGFYSGTVSSIEQYTLADFIKEGYYDRHINRMRNHYRICREQILAAIKESKLGTLVKIEEDSSGLHFLISFESKKTDKEITDILLEKGIKIRPVSDYCYHNYNKFSHRLIINYSNLNSDLLIDAFNTIYDLLVLD